MRKIPVEYVKEGNILGRTLYNNFGSIFLKKGLKLDKTTISKLKDVGCLSVYIEDRYSKQVIEEIIKPKTMSKIHSLQESLGNIILGFNYSGKVDTGKLNEDVRSVGEIIDGIIHDILNNKNVLENLTSISTYNNYTMNHSLNVMMLSTVIARDKGFNIKKIKKLAMGCMFHDIGKTFIPIEILKKPGILTEEEFEIVQTHSKKGYEFLRDYTDLPASSINVALCHHEREDGSGYPRNLKGEEIHLFSKIASICDVFDALTSDRPYRRAITVNEAMEYLLSSSGNQFSVETIKAFSNSINVFPKDTLVLLSDSREGVIYEPNNKIHSRPKIKIYGKEGKEVTPYMIDLMKHSNIVIEKVLYQFSFKF